ncbi:MAG: hypothetical protein GY834_10600 [Bacteroidetes bacterium]|nr:hypothetical protein [Bacteroidota bacterium]
MSANRRDGKSKKTIKSLDGKFELETPRDRDGNFSPQIVKKHQTTLSDEIERKMRFLQIKWFCKNLYIYSILAIVDSNSLSWKIWTSMSSRS